MVNIQTLTESAGHVKYWLDCDAIDLLNLTKSIEILMRANKISLLIIIITKRINNKMWLILIMGTKIITLMIMRGVVVVEDIEVEEYEDIEEFEDCDENVENSESDIENDEEGSARRTLYLDALRRWA